MVYQLPCAAYTSEKHCDLKVLKVPSSPSNLLGRQLSMAASRQTVAVFSAHNCETETEIELK